MNSFSGFVMALPIFFPYAGLSANNTPQIQFKKQRFLFRAEFWLSFFNEQLW
jgi:hypothetical protein